MFFSQIFNKYQKKSFSEKDFFSSENILKTLKDFSQNVSFDRPLPFRSCPLFIRPSGQIVQSMTVQFNSSFELIIENRVPNTLFIQSKSFTSSEFDCSLSSLKEYYQRLQCKPTSPFSSNFPEFPFTNLQDEVKHPLARYIGLIFQPDKSCSLDYSLISFVFHLSYVPLQIRGIFWIFQALQTQPNDTNLDISLKQLQMIISSQLVHLSEPSLALQFVYEVFKEISKLQKPITSNDFTDQNSGLYTAIIKVSNQEPWISCFHGVPCTLR